MAVLRLGDDAVEAGAFESREPVVADLGSRVIGVRWIGGVRRPRAASRAARGARAAAVAQVLRRPRPAHRRQRTTTASRRRASPPAMPPDAGASAARRNRARGRRDHDLAVDDAAVGSAASKRVVQLGEVAVERPQVAALDIHVALAAKDDGAEAVPFRARTEMGLPEATRKASRAWARSGARSGMTWSGIGDRGLGIGGRRNFRSQGPDP